MSFFLMVMFRVVMILSLPLLAMMIAYSMFWFPQIARSAQRGRAGALSKEYLVGTTVCRMCFAFCEYHCCFESTHSKRFQIS